MLFCLGFVSVDAQSAQDTSKAAPVPTLAVNNLEPHGLSESEALTLSDVFRSRLMETKKFKVMERSEMETILKEQAFQQSGACTEEACIVEMGQLLGIEQVIAGSIGKVGKAYSINIRVISVRSGEIIKSVTHSYTGPIENLLTTEMTVVAKKVAGIQTMFEPRVEKKAAKKPANNLRRNVIIGSVAAVAVGGGAVTLLLIKKKRENELEEQDAMSDLEVQWEF
jgi:curli biogenesis system outer membrane secretion channel CsgG